MESPKILIVGNESIIDKYIRDLLIKLGYDVPEVISTGKEAIVKVDELIPKLILMNIPLYGEMDSIDAAKKIQEKHDIPIIYLTSHIEDDTLKRARETTPYGYIVKPVGKNDLKTAIETALHRHEMEKRLRESENELKIRNRILEIFLTIPDEMMYVKVLEVVLDAMKSDYGTFGYFNQDGAFVVPAISREIYWEKCNVPEKDIIFGKGTFRGIWEKAVKEKKTLYSNNGPFNTPEGHIPIINTMATPIIYHGETISAFHVANKLSGYDENDKKLMDTIANHIAPILHARLQRNREEESRKHAEEKLRESEEFLLSVMNTASDSIFSINLSDRKIMFSNSASEKIFGYSQEEVIGQTTRMFYPDEDAYQSFGDALRNSLAKGKRQFWKETQLRKKSGELIWTEIGTSFVLTGDQPSQAVSIIRDITKRKNIEEELRRSVESYRTMAENLPGIVYRVLLKENNHMLFFNNMILPMTGYTAEELKSGDVCSIDPLILPEDRENVVGEVMKAIDENRPFIVEYRLMRKDGEICHFHERGKPIRSADGEPEFIDGVIIDITEHKRAEEELIKNETLLKDTQELAKVGGWEYDIEKERGYWTEEVYRIHEMPKDTTIDHVNESLKCFLPEDRSVISEAFRNCIEKGESYDMELPFVTFNNRHIWIRTTAKAIRKDGKIVRVMGNIIDISEQKRMENELREILEATTEGIWTWNFKTDELFFSPRYYTMLGYDPFEFPANYENWRNLIHPDDLEHALSIAEIYLETKPDSYENEFRLRAKNGDYRWILTQARVVERDVNGEAVRMVGNHEDITKRKQAERALRDSEEKYRTLFEAESDAIFLIDAQTIEILDANKAATDMYGYTNEELKKLKVTDLSAEPENTKKAIELEKRTQIPLRYCRKKDGTIFPVEITVSYRELSGRKINISAIRDITERMNVDERLKASLREKEILLKEVHHRVKNNLHVIISMLNLQQMRVDDVEARKVFIDSQNRVYAMALVHEKLYKSKDFTNMDFTEYVRIITSELYQIYQCDPNRVEFDIKGGRVQLGIDQAIPCGLIINELVSNSIKHAFPERLKKKCKIAISLMEKNNTIVLIVKDNGVGLSDDIYIEKADSLGLKLIQILIKNQLKGEYELSRKRGTSFTIRFQKKE